MTKQPRFSPEADAELDRFYGSVGSTTTEQKINLLELHLGESNFYHYGGATAEMKLACYEYEYLDYKGLIDLTLC